MTCFELETFNKVQISRSVIEAVFQETKHKFSPNKNNNEKFKPFIWTSRQRLECWVLFYQFIYLIKTNK